MGKNSRQVVLTFHGIGMPPAGVPAAERPYWISEPAFAGMIERIADAARRHDIRLAVTFDDGNKSDVLVAAPVLREHRLAGYFFPCAGRLGQPGYLDRDDLDALISGGFEIGSHGTDHLPWATLEGEALRQETAGSKAALESVTGRPVRAAALPFGSYNRRVLAAVRHAGYQQVFSSDPGLADAGAWFMQRFSYRDGMTFDPAQLVAEYSRPSRRLTGAAKHLVKALR